VEGDARHGIRTMAILYSPATALLAGHLLVGAAYLLTIGLVLHHLQHSAPSFKDLALLIGHVALLVLFIVNAFSIRLGDQGSVRTFYLRFWLFFFAEYALYLVAYVGPW